MKKTRGLFNQILSLAFMLEIFFCCEVFAQAGGQASLIEGAKKEGKVVWYATLNIMYPGKLKIAAIDPTVGEELSKYSKEFREIYFR